MHVYQKFIRQQFIRLRIELFSLGAGWGYYCAMFLGKTLYYCCALFTHVY